MQRKLALVVALFGTAAGLGVNSAATSSANLAKSWLHSHPAAQADELGELKSENPDAYAIVKALLTKRSLGLLDPKHPSAWSAAQPNGNTGNAPTIALSEPTEEEAGLPSPSDSINRAPVMALPRRSEHIDNFNWRPSTSNDDEAMVKSVLGAVAELKGKQIAPAGESSPLALDAASLEVEMPSHAALAASPSEAPVVKEELRSNSYLRGAGFAADMPAVAETNPSVAGDNYLSGISVDDRKQQSPRPSLQQTQQQVQSSSSSKIEAKHSSAISNWLFGTANAAVPKKQPKVDTNPYDQYTKDFWQN